MGTEATPLATAPTSPKPGIRPTRVVGWVALCAIALAPIVARSGYLSSIGCQIATSAIIVVGLGLLMGYAGQISLGHAAFYAVGAYSSAILTTKAGLHPLLALCAGAAASALLAFVVGTPAHRDRGEPRGPPLPHHRAYGSVHGGSVGYARDRASREGKPSSAR